MTSTVYLAIGTAMVLYWLMLTEEDDDDQGGGKMIPAYQQTDR